MKLKVYEKMIEQKESESVVVATCQRGIPTYENQYGELETWIAPRYNR